MKQLLILCLLIFTGLIAKAGPVDSLVNNDSLSREVHDDITVNIAAAIRAGDANKLAQYFNTAIDLVVPGSEGTYSKSQAEMLVKSFFSQYVPVSFSINQQGSSKDGAQFSIGTLVTKKGNFRTYFLIKKVNNTSLIHELQFEES